jgi:hypothetical protein
MSDYPLNHLSDEQFAVIVDAANTLRPALRSRFIETVKFQLPPASTVTNASLSAAIDAALRSLQVVG